MDWNYWTILDKDNHPYRLPVNESLTIDTKSLTLNSSTKSLPLLIYPEDHNNNTNYHKTYQQRRSNKILIYRRSVRL